MVRHAVYRCLMNLMAGRGRCCRTMGLSSSGPAALYFWKEENDCFMSVSVIQESGVRSLGLWCGWWFGLVVLPGKCSLSRVWAVSSELVVKEPSGFLIKLVVALVNLF